jgi:hypothetical protein
LSIVLLLSKIVSPPQNCLNMVSFIKKFIGILNDKITFRIIVKNFEIVG